MGFVMCGFCNVWVCVCVGFVMCGCFDNCMDVLVIYALVFTVFLCCFVYVYLFLFVAIQRTTATEWTHLQWIIIIIIIIIINYYWTKDRTNEWRYILCNFLHYPDTPSLLGTNILLIDGSQTDVNLETKFQDVKTTDFYLFVFSAIMEDSLFRIHW